MTEEVGGGDFPHWFSGERKFETREELINFLAGGKRNRPHEEANEN